MFAGGLIYTRWITTYCSDPMARMKFWAAYIVIQCNLRPKNVRVIHGVIIQRTWVIAGTSCDLLLVPRGQLDSKGLAQWFQANETSWCGANNLPPWFTAGSFQLFLAYPALEERHDLTTKIQLSHNNFSSKKEESCRPVHLAIAEAV